MRLTRRVSGMALCAAAVFGVFALPPTAHADAPGDSDFAAKLDTIFQKWNHEDSPGCALGVEHDGGQRFFRAFGSADLEHGAAIDTNTMFEAGSVSKQF